MLLFLLSVYFVWIQLKNKEELKQKIKSSEKECRCLQEKNNKLEAENEIVKTRIETVLKDNEDYAAKKVSIP